MRVGSFDIDDAIRHYLQSEYGLAVGEPTAEDTKKVAGVGLPRHATKRALWSEDARSCRACPRRRTLTPEEIRHAIDEPVERHGRLRSELPVTVPLQSLAQDIILHGIHLVGGGGLLRGMDLRLARATSVTVRRVESPLEAVVLGAGKCLENIGGMSVFSDDWD